MKEEEYDGSKLSRIRKLHWFFLIIPVGFTPLTRTRISMWEILTAPRQNDDDPIVNGIRGEITVNSHFSRTLQFCVVIDSPFIAADSFLFR